MSPALRMSPAPRMSDAPTSAVLVASDLDRTLIYSRTALTLGAEEGVDGDPSALSEPTELSDPSELACVEVFEQEPASYMTRAAAQDLAELAERVTFVPVTTRTPTQLARVCLPGRVPRFAIAANGGALLVDGVRDRGWDRTVLDRLSDGVSMRSVRDYVGRVCRPEWTSKIRDVEALFCYAVVDRAALPSGFLDEVTGWAAERGWSTSLQGRKLYWVPSALTKAAAVRELAGRIGAELTLAAGDSLLDRDLLECADAGIQPRHGELFDSGWRHASVRVTERSGVRAGQEILEWFLSAAARVPAPRF